MLSFVEVMIGICDYLVKGVEKWFYVDVLVGYLLFGGLDFFFVCLIVFKLMLGKKLWIFVIGMDCNLIDFKYVCEVVDYLGIDYIEFIMICDDVLGVLCEVIYILEIWDIMIIWVLIGMYFLCKKIYEMIDLKVILIGECFDEMFGYKYIDYVLNVEVF